MLFECLGSGNDQPSSAADYMGPIWDGIYYGLSVSLTHTPHLSHCVVMPQDFF